MADHKTALDHHAKAGTALTKGDFKKAAHHMGHAMNALKQAKATVAPKAMTLAEGQAAYMGRIRKAIKK